MRLTTIRTSHYVHDLWVLQSFLESEGINCFIKNEFTTQVMSHMANFVAELQVKSEDLERAQELLNEFDKG